MVKLDDREIKEKTFSPVCHKCQRLRDMDKRKCEAFSRIPSLIWNGENNHKEPFKGDNGLLFKPFKEAR